MNRTGLRSPHSGIVCLSIHHLTYQICLPLFALLTHPDSCLIPKYWKKCTTQGSPKVLVTSVPSMCLKLT